jgi:uroporphyrinogen III methyltransferase/synthase
VSESGGDVGAGIVYIVGAGPGDAGLITVRGRDLIARADAIVFDASVNRSLLPEGARESGHPVLYFVGRRGRDRRKISGRQVEELLVRLAREGKRVVRLTGGDPFVFGRGGDEAQALYDASVPFEVVPGITAGIAAVSYAGIPVTHRGMGASVTFVTGAEVPGGRDTQTDWSALAKSGGTIVIYAATESIGAIAEALLDGGMPEEIPAAAVERGTRRNQRTVTATLRRIADTVKTAGLDGPTTVIIGWPVILREEMSWFENRALYTKRIIVADPGPLGTSVVELLRELGAEVLQLPGESTARLDLSPLRNAMKRLPDFQWLILTSRHAVMIFWEQLLGSGRDARALAGVSIAAAGAETAAALLERGIAIDVIPSRFTSDSLLEKLRERDDVAGSRVLFVSPEGSDRDVLHELAEIGAEVTAIDAYRSFVDDRTIRRVRRALEGEAADMVAFTSVASVRSFVAAAGAESLQKVRAASIGESVSDALSDAGVEPECEAAELTAASLAAAIERTLA